MSVLCLMTTLLLCEAQTPNSLSSSELGLKLRKLMVLGSALYIAAHPDDENTAAISFLGKGRLLRTGYLSMTRGEGGQNLIGPEQGEMLGIIRTQELLAARRIDGGEQFFTTAIDFGYSKTSEETMGIWGKEKIVGDIVWVLRKFRPDVMITRFSDTLGGHGNHTASALLAREAFLAAGDRRKYPEQLSHVDPWQPKRIVFNIFRGGGGGGTDPSSKAVRLDVGAYSPLLGLSFTEISGMSRSMHKSQGFGAGQNRGSLLQYFEPTDGETANVDLMDGVDLTWSRIKGGARVAEILQRALTSFSHENPAAVVPILTEAYAALNALPPDPWVDVKRQELIEAILGCAGVWLDALASDHSAPPGGQLKVTAYALKRSEAPVEVARLRITAHEADTVVAMKLQNNNQVQIAMMVDIPQHASPTQPYWLREEPEKGAYRVAEQRQVGLPENPRALSFLFTLSVHGTPLDIAVPVRYRWIDPVDGEQYRPFQIVPPVSVNLAERVFVFADGGEKEIRVLLHAGGRSGKGTIRLNIPDGWKSDPPFAPFELKKKGDEAAFTFKVKPTRQTRGGQFRAVVDMGGEVSSSGLLATKYDHIPIQTIFPEAIGKLVRLDLKKKGERIGYITGSGDEIPAALKELGYSVKLLSDEELEFANLKNYGAIVAGVRAYNTRPKLKRHQERLMDYVKQGGTYIVQYVTRQQLESENLGPYPFEVSRDRVSVEEAPVQFNDPKHPLLNSPNRIKESDFDGWIQERGLYFADKWDPRYETVLECHDPGEPPRKGGLIVARHGRGYYIYTGYSFFRQLPAGVPGAYRLFVNLISVGK